MCHLYEVAEDPRCCHLSTSTRPPACEPQSPRGVLVMYIPTLAEHWTWASYGGSILRHMFACRYGTAHKGGTL